MSAGFNNTFGNDVAFHNAAEDIDQDNFDFRLSQHDFKSRRNFFRRSSSSDIKEVIRLTAEQFDETGTAELRLTFAGRPLTVRYHNAARKEAGSYRLGEVRCGDTAVTPGADGTVKLPRALVEQLPAEGGLITAELV